ncbi:bi-domain-containing oxidoreductase [Vibrio nigripulchritudo]|uniref:bi-domain-containing oxidoreductase n=1 Tax=Vibrio nigripulchritudo TaxID=28173 RepID=UPI002491AA08|nr:bi-domain-containing oxidoreductase [Vibrio nigripulchritudo]BDU38857.1 oxidoreductase [Vibrio nigripulchritudo]BDU44577.1 oxidoreductase [Vibrio nigripulchritudo]
MKQILQDMAKGGSSIVEAPAPKATKNHVVINTTTTLISAGTERMLVDFGKANLIDKARSQPDKVKMVLEKVQTDGLMTTVDAVKSKLAQPLPLGYCNVGVVEQVGSRIDEFKVGQRVVSNGPHADVVRVSKNLVAKIPANVSDEEAAFTVVASIGLQGIRLANPTMGESFVVTGVGLIGLLTVQMLRAQGCRVLAIDFDQTKLDMAKEFGAEICNPGLGEDPVAAGMAFSRGNGIDGVIITASTKSNEPVTQAARMSRKRGRIILVGVTGLELSRADFYEKELTFQVSCSYGPGRYDPNYENKGNDYPLPFVRWTEQRNFEAILDMMAGGQLNVKPLITHRILFENATEAYDLLTSDKSALGILLQYSSASESRHASKVVLNPQVEYKTGEPIVGFVGAGNYASRVLIPAFKNAGAQLSSISTSGGINGAIHGNQAGFKEATTDTDALIESDEINTVAIVTRHNSHAHFVKQSLNAGKNVFVEKPLAITHEELEEVKSAYEEASQSANPPKLMVGFNRRFAPQIRKMKSLIDPIKGPKSFIMTMNAGSIPADHWTQDITVGGGRIIGEACHFVDLMRFFVGSEIVSVQARRIGDSDAIDITEDKAAIILGFADGSIGTIHYYANGAASFPKERIEVFVDGKVLQLDNFVKLKGFGFKGFKKMNLWKQDKGQNLCSQLFLDSIRDGKKAPIDINEIFEVAKISIDIAEQLRQQ